MPTAISNPTPNAAHVFSDARQWQHYGPSSRLVYRRQRFCKLLLQTGCLSSPCDMPRLPENLVSPFETIAKRTPLCNAFYVETPSRPHYSVMFISVRKSTKYRAIPLFRNAQAYAAGCSSNAHWSFLSLMSRILSATTRKTIWLSLL